MDIRRSTAELLSGYNLLLKSVFGKLSKLVRETLQFQDTTHTIADGDGLSVCSNVVLLEQIGSISFQAEFPVSRIFDEGILEMTFLACQGCILCMDKSVLV